MGDKAKQNLPINEAHSKGTDPNWSEKVFAVTEVDWQRIGLNNGAYVLDDRLLQVPVTATDAETSAINKV